MDWSDDHGTLCSCRSSMVACAIEPECSTATAVKSQSRKTRRRRIDERVTRVDYCLSQACSTSSSTRHSIRYSYFVVFYRQQNTLLDFRPHRSRDLSTTLSRWSRMATQFDASSWRHVAQFYDSALGLRKLYVLDRLTGRLRRRWCSSWTPFERVSIRRLSCGRFRISHRRQFVPWHGRYFNKVFCLLSFTPYLRSVRTGVYPDFIEGVLSCGNRLIASFCHLDISASICLVRVMFEFAVCNVCKKSMKSCFEKTIGNLIYDALDRLYD